MSQLMRNPRLARHGVTVHAAPPAASSTGALASRTAPRSPFTDQLPQYQIERAYFHAIDAPSLTVFAGSAWFGLRSIKPSTLGQEFQLTGCAMTLLPTDSDGGALTGFATAPLAWGDTRGLSAAIVVGKNLPITPGAWTDSLAFVPGIDFGNVTPVARSLTHGTDRPADYIIVQGFPTGKFRDTAPNKPPFRWSFAPHVFRFAKNDRLDVALVLRGATVNNIATAPIVGLADIALTLGLTQSARDYTESR